MAKVTITDETVVISRALLVELIWQAGRFAFISIDGKNGSTVPQSDDQSKAEAFSEYLLQSAKELKEVLEAAKDVVWPK